MSCSDLLAAGQYEADGQMGLSLAIDGGDRAGGFTFVFGAPGIRIADNTGAVFAMQLFSDGTWQSVPAVIDAQRELRVEGGAFRADVAINKVGTLLVVSDVNVDAEGGLSRRGRVYVFERSGYGTPQSPGQFSLIAGVSAVET